MRLTPLDIKKQDFGRVLRGFDPEEVQAFLSMVADEWEDVRAEHRRMESKVRELEAKLDHYEKVEEALQEALQTAREQSESKLEQAERHAALTVQEARAQAREIVQEAEQRRQQLQSDIERLADRRDEVVARLRAFLNSELEVLSRFGGAHPLEPSGSAEGSSEEPTVESDDDRLSSSLSSSDEAEASDEASSPHEEESSSVPSSDYSRSAQAHEPPAEADKAPFAMTNQASASYGESQSESMPDEREADGEAAVDDALFDFFDLDEDEESEDKEPLGEEDTFSATSESAPLQAEDAAGEGAEPDGKDEIERIRRMLDELE